MVTGAVFSSSHPRALAPRDLALLCTNREAFTRAGFSPSKSYLSRWQALRLSRAACWHMCVEGSGPVSTRETEPPPPTRGIVPPWRDHIERLGDAQRGTTIIGGRGPSGTRRKAKPGLKRLRGQSQRVRRHQVIDLEVRLIDRGFSQPRAEVNAAPCRPKPSGCAALNATIFGFWI